MNLHVIFSNQIMDSGHVDEHAHISNHMTPGHALLAQDPPFFLTKDGVNFAALDYMTGIVRKVHLVHSLRPPTHSTPPTEQ